MASKTEYQKDLAVLHSVLQGPFTDQTKSEILQYFKLARIYFMPKRCAQDITLRADRVCDLIGGVPYASENNLWPVDSETKEHLQPILQLRLEKAGRLLGRDFGSGLLQVFGYSTENYGQLRFWHRVIRPECLRDPVCMSIPDSIARSIDFDDVNHEKSKILWRKAGFMLMGDFSYIDSNIDGSVVLDVNYYSKILDSTGKGADREIEFTESYEILDYVRSTPYFGTYLGGYGGNNGSLGYFLNIDPAQGSLLIRTGSEKDDAQVGVIVRRDKSGIISFDVEGCYL
jgi:hypothetical protein